VAVAREFTITQAAAMTAMNFAISQGISDGRIALFVGSLADKYKFDRNSLIAFDPHHYPLTSAALDLLEGKSIESVEIIENTDGLEGFERVMANFIALIAFLARRREHQSETEFLASFDARVEAHTHATDEFFSNAVQFGTKTLLINNLIDTFLLCKQVNTPYAMRLSGIIDGAIDTLTTSSLLADMVGLLKTWKNRVDKGE
jgi:hypothetical protein